MQTAFLCTVYPCAWAFGSAARNTPREKEAVMEDYRTLLGQGTGEYEEKHSRFIGLAQFADTEEKALAVLNGVRQATARPGTTCTPMCCGRATAPAIPTTASRPKPPACRCWEAIRHAGLTDCVVVVTRYFGGILLGTGRAGAGLHPGGQAGSGGCPQWHHARVRAADGHGGIPAV